MEQSKFISLLAEIETVDHIYYIAMSLNEKKIMNEIHNQTGSAAIEIVKYNDIKKHEYKTPNDLFSFVFEACPKISYKTFTTFIKKYFPTHVPAFKKSNADDK